MTYPPPPRLTLNLNLKKLLLSKWTAVSPVNKEKHFVVIKVLQPEPPVLDAAKGANHLASLMAPSGPFDGEVIVKAASHGYLLLMAPDSDSMPARALAPFGCWSSSFETPQTTKPSVFGMLAEKAGTNKNEP